MSKFRRNSDIPSAPKRPRISNATTRRLNAAQAAKLLLEADSDSDIDALSDNGDGMETEEDDHAMETEENTVAMETEEEASDIVDSVRNGICDGPSVNHVSKITDDKSTTDKWEWNTVVNVPTTSFTGQSGFRNMPESLSRDSKIIDFMDLFLDNEIIQKMVDATNLRASQTKSSKPDDYYGNLWSDVTAAEMRAFIGVRLSMEHLVIKPRYSDYFATSSRLTATPGFRSVFTRDRFLSIWKFWHLVDENDVNLNKADKLYKVRPFIDHIMKKFRHHYYPRQMLSIDEGMIPAKNRLSFKQYCKDKPTKWGIKAFLLTDSENGYLYNAEVYIGKSTDGSERAELGATGNIVRRLVTGLENQNHTVFLDRFYTSPTLFKYFIGEGFHACGTAMTNRKHFPKELIISKKALTRGQHKFLCSEQITAVVWFDKQPIYFLSSYHDPSMTTLINRKNKDGTVVAVTCPQLVVDYNRFMGGVDHNDQMTKLYKPRKHYRWPRRLFLKCVMWACYNAYIVAGHYIPHRPAGSRPYTFTEFTEDCVDGLIAGFQTTSSVRRRSGADEQTRLQNVGVHFPERSSSATGNNRCRVCREKFQRFKRSHPEVLDKDNPHPLSKTRMWCSHCKEFLCVRESSTCFKDYHMKKEFWR